MLALLLASARSMSAREWWNLSPTYLNVTAIVCTVVLLWFGAHYLYRRIVQSNIVAKLQERQRAKARTSQGSAMHRDTEDDKARVTIRIKKDNNACELTVSKSLADRIRDSASSSSVVVEQVNHL